MSDKHVRSTTADTKANAQDKTNALKHQTGPGLKVLTTLGRIRTFQTSKMINKNARLYHIQAHYSFKKGLDHKFDLMLKKLRRQAPPEPRYPADGVPAALVLDKDINGGGSAKAQMTTAMGRSKDLVMGRLAGTDWPSSTASSTSSPMCRSPPGPTCTPP